MQYTIISVHIFHLHYIKYYKYCVNDLKYMWGYVHIIYVNTTYIEHP